MVRSCCNVETTDSNVEATDLIEANDIAHWRCRPCPLAGAVLQARVKAGALDRTCEAQHFVGGLARKCCRKGRHRGRCEFKSGGQLAKLLRTEQHAIANVEDRVVNLDLELAGRAQLIEKALAGDSPGKCQRTVAH